MHQSMSHKQFISEINGETVESSLHLYEEGIAINYIHLYMSYQQQQFDNH